MKRGEIWRGEGRNKEWLSVKGKSGERGSEKGGKGLESWVGNETDSATRNEYNYYDSKGPPEAGGIKTYSLSWSVS